jgi:hypothetical protein
MALIANLATQGETVRALVWAGATDGTVRSPTKFDGGVF